MLALLVCVPFVGALLVCCLSSRLRVQPAWLAGLTVMLGLTLLITLGLPVYDGELLLERREWIAEVGLSLAFRLDGLGLLFAQLILGIGLLVVLYARYYLSVSEGGPRFYAYLLLFMGAMLGLVLSENMLQMLLFWELTSLASFLLIGFRRHQAEARQGARLALFITGGGGLALLAAVILMGQIVGSYELSAVFDSGQRIENHPLYPVVLTLFLLGVATKSAQFPFHFWLPHAMSAPTPVSAYLHSATMVKAGIFLLGRFFPVLAGTELWFYAVSSMGLATLLLGAYFALFQHDLKGLLAYSTISHLGLITLLFGLGTPLGEIAAIFHILNHAVFKASLFMAAGIIDHETGSRDMRRLNGLFKYMPYTALLAMVAAAAMAGVPLLNGFLSKEMFFGETLGLRWLSEADWHWMFPWAATLAGVFAVAYSLRFIHDVFFNGEPRDLPRTPHEPPRWMKVPVEILVVLCVLDAEASLGQVGSQRLVQPPAVLFPGPVQGGQGLGGGGVRIELKGPGQAGHLRHQLLGGEGLANLVELLDMGLEVLEIEPRLAPVAGIVQRCVLLEPHPLHVELVQGEPQPLAQVENGLVIAVMLQYLEGVKGGAAE